MKRDEKYDEKEQKDIKTHKSKINWQCLGKINRGKKRHLITRINLEA